MLGVTTQAELLEASPAWVDELVRSTPDESQAQRLAAPAAGKEVVVFLGSWCSDSRRELTRLWRAVEMAGGDFGFPVRYIAVDRTKTEPAELLEGTTLLYVPTLIVFENGAEVGRIVETAPNGIESDLADLIDGTASGWLSGRDDLAGRGRSSGGHVGGAFGCDARRGDAVDAVPSSRSRNAAAHPKPPPTRRAARGYGATGVSLVVDDDTASTPPRSYHSHRKPVPRDPRYFCHGLPEAPPAPDRRR